jgi:hypothetical protein
MEGIGLGFGAESGRGREADFFTVLFTVRLCAASVETTDFGVARKKDCIFGRLGFG